MHLRAARWASNDAQRLVSLLDAAAAALDGFEFDRAVELATAGGALAREIRSSHAEARAEWIDRSARYRRGDDLDTDLDGIAATSRLGVPQMEALVLQNEAAIAWRCGAREQAREFAGRGSREAARAGREPVAMLLRSLAVAAGESLDSSEVESLATCAAGCEVPGLAAQGAALLAAGGHPAREILVGVVQRAVEKLPIESRHVRREVLSLNEALELVGVSPGWSGA